MSSIMALKPLLLTMVIMFITTVLGKEISCPTLQCDDPLEDGKIDYDLCWSVDETQPLMTYTAHKCEWYLAKEKSNLEIDVISTCDFSASSGEYAWVDELTQDITASNTEGRAQPENSQFKRKKTKAYCREVAAFNQKLNNGRSCSSSLQCNTGVCDSGKCVGLEIGANCHSNMDCAEGQFCERERSWPFWSTCSKLRTSYQSCRTDYECVAGSYCWFAAGKNVEEDLKNEGKSNQQSSK